MRTFNPPERAWALRTGRASCVAKAAGDVLTRWKMAPAYCMAVLAHEHRVALDGSPAEAIDASAKDLAAKRLARLAESETVKGDTKLTTPARVISRPAERQPEMPEQLRARVRASLMRRRA